MSTIPARPTASSQNLSTIFTPWRRAKKYDASKLIAVGSVEFERSRYARGLHGKFDAEHVRVEWEYDFSTGWSADDPLLCLD